MDCRSHTFDESTFTEVAACAFSQAKRDSPIGGRLPCEGGRLAGGKNRKPFLGNIDWVLLRTTSCGEETNCYEDGRTHSGKRC